MHCQSLRIHTDDGACPDNIVLASSGWTHTDCVALAADLDVEAATGSEHARLLIEERERRVVRDRRVRRAQASTIDYRKRDAERRAWSAVMSARANEKRDQELFDADTSCTEALREFDSDSESESEGSQPVSQPAEPDAPAGPATPPKLSATPRRRAWRSRRSFAHFLVGPLGKRRPRAGRAKRRIVIDESRG